MSENINFEELKKLEPDCFNMDVDNEIFNLNFIIDMYEPKYKEYYYENNQLNNNIEQKTKLDYIEKIYLDEPLYKDNVKI